MNKIKIKSFTLVEIIMATFIFTLFMGGIIALMRGAPRQFDETAKQKAADSNSAVALQALIKDIQMALADTKVSDFKEHSFKIMTFGKAEKGKESDLLYASEVSWDWNEAAGKLTRKIQPKRRDKKGEWKDHGKKGQAILSNVTAFNLKTVKVEGAPGDLARAVGVQVVSTLPVAGSDKVRSSISQTTVFLRGTNSVGMQPRWNTNALYSSSFLKITGGRITAIEDIQAFIDQLKEGFNSTLKSGIGDFVDDMKSEVTKGFKDNMSKYAGVIGGKISEYKETAIGKYSAILVDNARQIENNGEKFREMVKEGFVGAALEGALDFGSSSAKDFGLNLVKDLESGGKSVLNLDKLQEISSKMEKAVHPGLSDYFDKLSGVRKEAPDFSWNFNQAISNALNNASLPGGKKLEQIFVTQKEFQFLKEGKIPDEIADKTGLTLDKINAKLENMRGFIKKSIEQDDTGKSVPLTTGISNHLEKYFHMLTDQGLNDVRKEGAQDAIEALASKAEERFSSTFKGLINTSNVEDSLSGWPEFAKEKIKEYENKLADSLSTEIFGKQIGKSANKVEEIKASLMVNKSISLGGFDLFGKLTVKGAGKDTVIGGLINQILDPKDSGKPYHEKILEERGSELPDTEKDWATKQLGGVVNQFFEGKKEDPKTGEVVSTGGTDYKKALYDNFGIDVKGKTLSGKYTTKDDVSDADSAKKDLMDPKNEEDFKDY